MISGYRQLTGRYLRASKKRTILTLIGIILSVALISSIGLFFYSMQITQIQDAKNTFGSFHLLFTKADESLINKIKSNPKVSRSGYYKSIPIGKIGEMQLIQFSATDKALELLPFHLKAGRLPENQYGTAIEEWSLKIIDAKAKIGDKIKVGGREYNLTGILDNNVENQVKNMGMILLKNNNIDTQNAELLVELNSKTNMRKAIEELKELAPKGTVIENDYLLMMMGVSGSNMGGLYLIIGIIIGIVVISTIAVIYNSFQISVVDRIKQFGLLRAVGATPRQIRKLVMREATVLAVIGIPLGLLCGLVAIYAIGFAFKIIGGDSVLGFNITISPLVLVGSGAIGILSIYISALIPALFAGKISPLAAISSSSFISKEKFKRRRSFIIQKIFGFEGVMASKNIKRNKKRYRVTVFSVVISVVLFVAFKSYMDMTLNIYKTINESRNIHFTVMKDGKAAASYKITNNLVQNIKALDITDKVYRIYDPYEFEAEINKNSEIKDVREIGKIYGEPNSADKDKITLNSSITPYDKDSLNVSKKYLEAGSIDIDRFNKENGVIFIDKSTIYNEKTKKKYIGPIANVKVGDEILLRKNIKDKHPQKVKIMAVVHDEPFNYRGSQKGLKLITTEEVASKLANTSELNPAYLNIKIKDAGQEEEAKAKIENTLKDNSQLKLINNIDENRKSKTTILIVKILLYGFVIVVSLIGSVNIVNTITTNIILRKREFAALKSIGMTQKGLRKMIILEGVLYGTTGTVYGSAIGCGLSYLMYKGLGEYREFIWSIPWNAIIIAGFAAILIGYLSVLAPISRIKKENLIESIREEY